MKTYHGYRRMHKSPFDSEPMTAVCVVHVVEGETRRPLAPRQDIRNHSPTGFEWGYGGSGPAQLALALVADCCGEEFAEPRIYQRVKRIVARLPHDGWVLTEQQVRSAVSAAEAEINQDQGAGDA